MKALLAIVTLTWWLFYWDGEHWITFGSWDTRSIGGERADDERVYILTGHSKGFATPSLGAVGSTTTELRVFWLASSIACWRDNLPPR